MRKKPQRQTVHTGTAVILILTLLFLIYGQTIVGRAEQTGFAWIDDSIALVQNPHLQDAWDTRGLKALVTSPYFYDWTPVYWTIIWVERGIMGNHAAGYRAVSLLLFGLCMILLYALLKKWTERPGLALFLVTLLTAHPLMIESLTWPTTQKTVLSLLVALGALWAYDRSLETGARPGYRILVFALCAVGPGIKLRSLVLPVCLLAYDMTRGLAAGRTAPRALLAALRRTVPLILVAGAWALYNQALVFNANDATEGYEAYLGGSLATSLASHAVIELRTLGHWLRPDAVYYYHDFSIYDPTDWQAWAAGIASLAILGLLIRAAPANRRHLAWFGATWYVVQRGLTAGVFPNQWGTMHNRYCTVASVGLLILFGLALLGCIQRPRWRDFHRAQVWLAISVVAVLAAFSHVNSTWLLMEAGRPVVTQPGNVRAQLRDLLQSSGAALDEDWEHMRHDRRAPATIGQLGLADAAVHWASDRVRRDLPPPDELVEHYCRQLPAPYSHLCRARYAAAAGQTDQLWDLVYMAIHASYMSDWLVGVDADLRAGRERDWHMAYLRIGDGSARFREVEAISQVIHAAYDAAPDHAGRMMIATLARGLAPEATAWDERYAALQEQRPDPDHP